MRNLMNLRRFLGMAFYGIFLILLSSGATFSQNNEGIISATGVSAAPFVNAWESFSYPIDIFPNTPNTAGDSIHGGTGGVNLSDVGGEGGWTSPWVLEATSYEAELSETQIDTTRIGHQDALFFPGSYSLEITTPAINGPKRSFPEVQSGELWITFLFQDSGPTDDHDSGLFVLNREGKKLFLLGKPRNASTLGVGGLPNHASDRVTSIAYTEPHELMARIVLHDGAGQNDGVYLWIDPNENDRLDTYDAGGENLAETGSLAAVMLSRRQNAGSGFFDDLCISTAPSLAPAGSERVDLGFSPDSPLRQNSEAIVHDVISMDAYFDAVQGDGYGHNKNQNAFMVVRGYIYYTESGDSRVARGIPSDRLSGLSGFAVAPFNNALEDSGWKNALRFAPENGTATSIPLSFTPGAYYQCRLLTSGDGFGTLSAMFTYSDGSTAEASIQSPDWLDDPVNDGNGGVIPASLTQINNGMNRLNESSYFEGSTPVTGKNPQLDDASFFEAVVPLDKSKTLTEIQLGPSSGSVINVYDLLLDVENGATPVREWMMY